MQQGNPARALAVAALVLTPAALWMGATVGHASAPVPVDVSAHRLTCNSVSGRATPDPPLSNALAAGTRVRFALRATLDGCVDTSDPSVVLGPARLDGTLSRVAGGTGCLDLLGARDYTGTLIATFTPAPGTPDITPRRTSITPHQLTGRTLTMPFAVANPPTYGLLQFGADPGHGATAPAPTVTGAFTGGDGGARSTLDVTTSRDVLTFAAACAGEGITTIDFGNGTLTLG